MATVRIQRDHFGVDNEAFGPRFLQGPNERGEFGVKRIAVTRAEGNFAAVLNGDCAVTVSRVGVIDANRSPTRNE